MATAGDEGVGLAGTHLIPLLHPEGTVGRITTFVVRADHRGQGIGARLLRAAEENLWGRGCERIKLTSGDGRMDAHRFYQREGYREESRRIIQHRPPMPCTRRLRALTFGVRLSRRSLVTRSKGH